MPMKLHPLRSFAESFVQPATATFASGLGELSVKLLRINCLLEEVNCVLCVHKGQGLATCSLKGGDCKW